VQFHVLTHRNVAMAVCRPAFYMATTTAAAARPKLSPAARTEQLFCGAHLGDAAYP
jgi:hypothetical protein